MLYLASPCKVCSVYSKHAQRKKYLNARQTCMALFAFFPGKEKYIYIYGHTLQATRAGHLGFAVLQ